jgi:hypothetical protein
MYLKEANLCDKESEGYHREFSVADRIGVRKGTLSQKLQIPDISISVNEIDKFIGRFLGSGICRNWR